MPLFAGRPRPYWSLHNLLRGAAKQLLPQGLLISAPWCHQPFGRLLLVVYKRQKAGMSTLVVAKKQVTFNGSALALSGYTRAMPSYNGASWRFP